MGRKDTKVIKGIAILYMIFHHLFYNVERYSLYNLCAVIKDAETTINIAMDLKVCVAIFSLLSGYGMVRKMKTRDDYSDEKYFTTLNNNIYNNYLSFIKDISFVFICLVIIAIVFKLEKQPSNIWGENIYLGILANLTGTAKFLNVEWYIASWWYISIALSFVFLFPLIYQFLRKVGPCVTLFLSLFFIPGMLDINVKNDTFFRYLPAFLCGMIMAEFDSLERLFQWIERKRVRIILFVFGCIVSYILVVYFNRNWDYMYISQTAMAVLTCMFVSFFNDKTAINCRILEILGNNSKYMWLIHTYIYSQFMDEIFSLSNIWIIYCAVVLLSLIFSIVLKQIFLFICKASARYWESK